MSDNNLAALQTDLTRYQASNKEKALLKLAEAITINPKDSSVFVRLAVRAGWSDEQVAETIFVASYYNMLSRIAVSFALPPDKTHSYPLGATLPLLPSEK